MSVYDSILEQRQAIRDQNRIPTSIELGVSELIELAAEMGIPYLDGVPMPTEPMWAGWFPSTKPNSFPIYLVPQPGVRVLDGDGDGVA